ncbi:hypothetical protein C0Q70_21155 [Pomacea canaliculata]|uniref:Uncharacterized protein n=1 Tax=Pomacea canaliculata TaxID=400727 RepID=A0A2T7NBR5_POMCA|nr:hypothetical protein C0Q70_21155 [Pomacea canaliculata]
MKIDTVSQLSSLTSDLGQRNAVTNGAAQRSKRFRCTTAGAMTSAATVPGNADDMRDFITTSAWLKATGTSFSDTDSSHASENPGHRECPRHTADILFTFNTCTRNPLGPED